MFTRVTGAVMRAVLMVLLVATPAMVLPASGAEASPFVLLAALFAAALIFVEYYSDYPSIIEFRFAPPFNRMRYVALLTMLFALSSALAPTGEPSAFAGLLRSLGSLVGSWLDIPYSPLQLRTLILPEAAPETLLSETRMALGLALLIACVVLLAFTFVVRILDWPARNGAFNVWINLPLFDPTAGGDVVPRLTRDGRLNIAFGILMLFFIPAGVQMLSEILTPIPTTDPATLVWTVALWVFTPLSMTMRGIAMMRIATLIGENRKRAYAAAEGLQIG